MHAEITLRLLCFGPLVDCVGRRELTLRLPASASVADAIGRMRELYPDAAPILNASRVAVNQRFVSGDSVLVAGDEVALLPPVSGG